MRLFLWYDAIEGFKVFPPGSNFLIHIFIFLHPFGKSGTGNRVAFVYVASFPAGEALNWGECIKNRNNGRNILFFAVLWTVFYILRKCKAEHRKKKFFPYKGGEKLYLTQSLDM